MGRYLPRKVSFCLQASRHNNFEVLCPRIIIRVILKPDADLPGAADIGYWYSDLCVLLDGG